MNDFASFQAAMGRIDDEAQERDAFGHRPGLRAGVDRQAQAGQPVNYGLAPGPERRLVVAEEQEVVHVTDVAMTV